MNKKRVSIYDIILQFGVYFSAALTVFVLSCLIIYVLYNGLPYISFDFLISKYSENDESQKGILPMLINTLYIVVITLLISLPIGIGSAIYMSQYARQGRFIKLVRMATEVLSGIPSIIFGLFGYTVFCGLFKLGTSIIAGCLTMTICILPLIIRTTEESLNSVPSSYKEGAIALGTTKLKVIFDIILPCALPGVITAIILAIGRIVGESAALLYTSGMSYTMPKGFFKHIFSSGRTLTLHLYQSAKQANTPDAFHIAFATASVLLILILLFNFLAKVFSNVFRRE